ncbi:DUF368 domain-containing protein [Virgibacillus sp. W0430]|uniref:DUF368 domain-containing protein n=1 Tax=Virgibacillus sp. W0430 TaxID=3391580 RepID=UPI003F4886D4
MQWKNIYRGIAMGASDVVPGVSGGTIAVLLGFYDQLIAAINGFFTKNWRTHLSFLLPLGLGVVFAIFTLSKLMDWLLLNYPVPTFFFFIGLIIGVLPLLFREADAKNTFQARHIGLIAVGAVLVGMLVFFKDSNPGAVITDRTVFTYILLFFSGVAASAAMILPGISGSLVLLIIGVYSTVMRAISNLELPVIIVMGLGIVFGIIVMSKVIHYFFKHYRIAAFALIIGLVIGSIVVIFPGWPTDTFMLVSSIASFAAGLFVAYILGKTEYV